MENGFSVLMTVFGAALLLYAAALSSGNPNVLPLRVQPSLRKDNQKEQVRHIAKITALVALCPVIGGLIGYLTGKNLFCLIGMIVTAAVLIVLSVMRKRSGSE